MSLFLFSVSAEAKTDAEKNGIAWENLESSLLRLRDHTADSQTWLQQWAIRARFILSNYGLREERNRISPTCQWKNFRIAHAKLNLNETSQLYLQRCEDQILRRGHWPKAEVWRSLMVDLQVDEHPFLRRVMLRLSDGTQLPGLLGLKDASNPRPLVIFRSGVFGNSAELFAERFFVMMLFEQSLFNFLLLDSNTSPGVFSQNDVLLFGGHHEGLQNIEIAKRLRQRDEPLGRITSELMLAGVSLGGHSLWRTLGTEGQKHLFRSAVAFCPVVELQKTYEHHRSKPISFFLGNAWTWLRLRGARSEFQSLSVTNTIDGMIGRAMSQEKDNFWKQNDLFQLISQIEIPTAVFYTRTDSAVPYALNGQALETAAQSQSWLSVLPLKHGSHCSLPGTFNWREISSFVLDQFNARIESKAEELVLEEVPTGSSIESVTTDLGLNHLIVQVGNGTDHRETIVPLARLDWNTTERIRSGAEAHALIRWFSHQAQFVVKDGGAGVLTWPGAPIGK